MTQDRFDSLEAAGALPTDLKAAIEQLSRFEHLEIGLLEAEPRTEAPILPALPPMERVACPHCGQLNEKARELCWACHRFVGARAAGGPVQAPQEIVLVLDGVTYKSDDPGLPQDIQALMDRIRRRGYSQELLAEWRSWRATRNANLAPARPFPEEAPAPEAKVEVFRGQRVSVIRLDGKVYLSDDPNLTPEFRRLFAYIEENGVTPALMEQLRLFGSKVKYRPSVTADPSDGDLRFWQDAKEREDKKSAK